MRGGDYTVARWAAHAAPALLAVHGITSTHMSWTQVIRGLHRRYDIYAPDLRGRGGSRNLPGPFGLRAHAEDLLALLDAHDIGKALYVGHSLGAYIGVVFAGLAPHRLTGLVLLDGGVALPLPEGQTAHTALEQILGPALTRLEMSFPDHASYREFWRRHPAFQDPREWSAELEAAFDYDLVGEPPRLRSSVNPAAVRADGRGPLDPGMARCLDEVRVPTLLLTAPRGVLNQPQPMLSAQGVVAAVGRNPNIRALEIPDTNHYTILLGTGAPAVARHIDRFAGTLAIVQ